MANPNSMTLIIETSIDLADNTEGVPNGFLPNDEGDIGEITPVPVGQEEAEQEVVETTSFEQAQDLLEDNIASLAAKRNKPMRPVTVLIDGPSGSRQDMVRSTAFRAHAVANRASR